MRARTGKPPTALWASYGRGIALTLAESGASVVINYAHSADKAQEVVSTIEAKGGKALAVQADISQVRMCVVYFKKRERGITVNTVLPGVTETEMNMKTLPEQVRQAMSEQTPLRRLGQPQDIADVVAFLVSDKARWITGQNIRAAGGLI